MSSLKSIVEKHGFGVKVQCSDSVFSPFTIISQSETKDCYKVECENGAELDILQECETTNDYEPVEKLVEKPKKSKKVA